MRLFFDCRYVRFDFHDGISRYSASLVEALAGNAEVTMLISDERQVPMLPDLPHVRISSPTSSREPFVARQINQLNPDVVFSPMQTMGSRGRNYPLILTVHDLIYYQHRTPPRNLPAHVRAGWWLYHMSFTPQRFLLNGADAIATVSQTTADLLDSHRLTKRPVRVIGNAPQPVETPRLLVDPPRKSLVYMGSFMDYKNVETVIAGLNGLPDFQLHLCSRISDSRRRELLALADDPDQLIFHNGVSDQEYRALLCDATALVSLSQAEGFGIPVVEAMSYGTPVVASRIPIFEEVAGSAIHDRGVQLVAPLDSKSFISAVRNLEDFSVFQRASASVLQRSQDFSWQDSAQKLYEFAEETIRRR